MGATWFFISVITIEVQHQCPSLNVHHSELSTLAVVMFLAVT